MKTDLMATLRFMGKAELRAESMAGGSCSVSEPLEKSGLGAGKEGRQDLDRQYGGGIQYGRQYLRETPTEGRKARN